MRQGIDARSDIAAQRDGVGGGTRAARQYQFAMQLSQAEKERRMGGEVRHAWKQRLPQIVNGAGQGVHSANLPQFFSSRRQDLASPISYEDRVFDANPAPSFDVNAGFHGDGHASLKPGFVLCADARRLVDFEA